LEKEENERCIKWMMFFKRGWIEEDISEDKNE
jgi:hypothetical protein